MQCDTMSRHLSRLLILQFSECEENIFVRSVSIQKGQHHTTDCYYFVYHVTSDTVSGDRAVCLILLMEWTLQKIWLSFFALSLASHSIQFGSVPMQTTQKSVHVWCAQIIHKHTSELLSSAERIAESIRERKYNISRYLEEVRKKNRCEKASLLTKRSRGLQENKYI